MIGSPSQGKPLPAGLKWPDDEQFADTRAELFKIRNGQDAVVGVASRIAASHEDSGDIIEWVLHLPARGSAYIGLRPEVAAGGYRSGELTAGTREFASLRRQPSDGWLMSQE